MSILLMVHVAQERLLGYQQVNISASTSFRRCTWISLGYLPIRIKLPDIFLTVYLIRFHTENCQ